MAIPLIGLIPKIIKTAASILGVDSVKDVVDALESNKLTPEQKVALDAAAKQFEVEQRQIDTEQMKQFVAEAIAEVTSADKYVSRARPTGLYIAYLATLALTGALVFQVKIDIGPLISLLTPLYGAGGYYMYLRTKEKMNGNGGD